jgi:hypothetical protein
MVITKKIEKNEKEIDAERAKIIEKGAGVSLDNTKKEEERKSIVIRMPADFLEKIDTAVSKRVGMNRMAWILQAAQEKLERDQ